MYSWFGLEWAGHGVIITPLHNMCYKKATHVQRLIKHVRMCVCVCGGVVITYCGDPLGHEYTAVQLPVGGF